MRWGLGILSWGLLLAAQVGVAAEAAPSASAAPARAPVLVEMFTSKYCPSCPMAEAKMKGVAADNPDLLVIFEHVDYWDRSPTQKDPYGLAEVTQRQYDYSNTLGKRAGQVFTPMPLLEGQILVNPPLMFSWGSALERGRALPAKVVLTPKVAADGALTVEIPPALRGRDAVVWVMGLDPVDDTKVWRTTGLVEAEIKGTKARLAGPMRPKGVQTLVLVQERGPGAVLGMGWI